MENTMQTTPEANGNEFVVSCGGIQPDPVLPPTKAVTVSNLTAREWNRIICAVNAKQTAEDAGIKTEEELQRYASIWNEAEELFAKYGNWPVFDLVELE